MSRLQSLRLAQFWRLRFEPLLHPSTRFSTGEVFEAVGWLVEGVFCGFFDAHEANVIWVRLDPFMAEAGRPSPPLVSASLSGEITKLNQSSEPFRQSLQMPEGAQKKFELPLFPHALLLGNRFFADRLARLCISGVGSQTEDEWLASKGLWASVEASDVAQRLADPEAAPDDVPSFVAGYMRLLEHMEASRSFFEYAKSRSPRRRDFESYCQRIGGLNAWRVPLYDSNFRSRFEDLSDSVEFTVRPEIERKLPEAAWSDFQKSFFNHLSSTKSAWETHHLSASLATA